MQKQDKDNYHAVIAFFFAYTKQMFENGNKREQ